MSLFHGDEDEMGSKDHALSIDEADRLLSGHTPSGRHDLEALAADLASLSATYHRAVEPTVVRRWATQAAVHARLAPTDKGDLAATPASNAIRPASQASGLPKRRIPVLDSIAAFLATTLGKAVAAGALVAATTTGGLAATGNLPGQDDGSPETILSVSDGHADGPEVEGVDDDADDACDGLEGAAHDACEAGATTPPADPAADPLACDDDDVDDDADEVEGVDDDLDEADDDADAACDDDEQESDDIESDEVESDDDEADDELDEVEADDDLDEPDADEVDSPSDDTEHDSESSDGSDAEEDDAD